MTQDPPRGRDARYRSAVAVLDAVRRHPGVTRSAMSQLVGLGSGSAAEVTSRLRELQLLDEGPARVTGPGRPTTVLRPHARGPVVIAVDLRQEDWRLVVTGSDGVAMDIGRDPAARRHERRDPAAVIATVGVAIRGVRAQLGSRVRAVAVAVPGAVIGDTLVQASTLDWAGVDLALLAGSPDVPLVVGNDATLAGVAEARSGAAAGVSCALHLSVVVGIGGALVIDGQPVTGASGAAGEYGHLPFGSQSLLCPCGASGCWDLEVDGRALARHRGEPPPRDPATYARGVLAAVAGGAADPGPVDTIAAALARGIAGLVNAHDPQMVTLGGLGWAIREIGARAFDPAYVAGLMTFRRRRPTPIVRATHGEEGAIRGAVEVALDRVITEASLAAWAEQRANAPIAAQG